MTKQEEIRGAVTEMLASCLSDNDVRDRADELLNYLHSQGVVILTQDDAHTFRHEPLIK